MSQARQCEGSSGSLGQNDFLWPLVVTKSQKDGLPKLLVACQFLIRDLRYQLRLQECDVPLVRRIDERDLINDQRLEFRVESRQCFSVEAGVNLADVAKPPVLVGAPRSNAPKCWRDPCGAVKPAMTNSSS